MACSEIKTSKKLPQTPIFFAYKIKINYFMTKQVVVQRVLETGEAVTNQV